MLARGRRAMRFVGWTEATLRAFLALHDPIEQRTFWRTRLDTWRWRTALGALLSPLTLRRFYPAPLLRAVPDGFARIVRRRLERGFSTHPNCTNPYARWLLLGEPVPAPQPGPAATLTVVHADAVEFLESCPPASFGAFTLSNIADGAGESVAARLRAAAGRAAEPGAVIVERSFAEPQNPDEELWAARDRALIWGRIHVETKI
jgi:S-adenosylmethionine:diacylglycerol 3-amino-3-carboxypropyl transferase